MVGSLTVGRRRSLGRLTRRKIALGLLFCSPWLLGFFIFTAYPVVASLIYSFTNYNILNPPRWVGLANYRALITDPLLGQAVYNTLYYTALYVPLSIVISLGLAMLLNLNVRGMSFYRSVFFLPYVIPQVVLALLWAWILNPQVGLANSILTALHIPGPGWLSDPNWSKPSIVVMTLWGGVGGTMVIFLAGLRDISRHLYEAAEIDGAGTFRKAWHVTLPMLTPVIFYNIVLGVIGSLQTFTTVYVATSGEGGPLNTTTFYALLLYFQAFRYFHMGYASAMAWLLFLFIFLLTAVLMITSRRWVYYEAGPTNG